MQLREGDDIYYKVPGTVREEWHGRVLTADLASDTVLVVCLDEGYQGETEYVALVNILRVVEKPPVPHEA